ncbi:MAG: inositol monophosphatase family protein [Pseudomonadota bacterium]
MDTRRAMLVNIDQVSTVIRDTAAQEVMPRFRSLREGDIRDKGRGDLVTVADVATEEVLSQRLKELLPGCLVIGEEAVAADPTLMDQLSSDRPIWIIDPIDGTGNFARGRDVFAVMVALVQAGRSLGGWIYDPVHNRMAVAEVGSGAFLDECRVNFARGQDLTGMTGTLHASTFASPDLAERIAERRSGLNTAKSMSCAGREYMRMLEGGMQYSLFSRLMPWDHVPGSLLMQEAGGVANCLDGEPYAATRYGLEGLILAASDKIWQRLYDILFQA